MSHNPLFELVVSSIHNARKLTLRKVMDFVLHAPENYEQWWTTLLKEAPQHVIIETLLIAFIIWLLFIRKTVDPKKASNPDKLSSKEIDWLLDTWEPEPLVPKLTDKDSALVQSELLIEEVRGDLVKIRGVEQPVLVAANLDFLALSRDEEVKQAARDALDKYGCGSCGPRGFYGTIDQHLFLEDALAAFMGTEEAIYYSEGASAVTSAIPAFAKKGDLLIIDDACAEPVLTGANLSRATVRFFRHNDMQDLEKILQAVADEDTRLKRDATQQRRFIVTEGIYRNTGDMCPLREILALKEKYFYRLILDETLSFGTTGATGRGVTEYFGLSPSDVEVVLFSLDTVIASVGGVCVGRRGIIDHQRLSGAGYCFSASTAPFLCASAVAALEKLKQCPQLVHVLGEKSQELFAALQDVQGLKTLAQSATPVMQLVLSQELPLEEEQVKIQAIFDYCIHNGVGVVTSKFALYKENRPSIMVCANVSHTNAQIQQIAQTLASAVSRVL